MIPQLLISPDPVTRIDRINQILEENDLTNPHPDLLVFADIQKIGIKESQEIISFLSLKPYQAKGKAIVIQSANNLTPDAQNALLKILEEPPTDAIILLGTNSESALLPTVVSRCQVTNLDSSQYSVDSIKYKKELESLEGMSMQERFELIEKLDDKREDFFKELISFYREKLIENPSLIEFVKELIKMEEYKGASVNLRGILEYLMLILPNSKK